MRFYLQVVKRGFCKSAGILAGFCFAFSLNILEARPIIPPMMEIPGGPFIQGKPPDSEAGEKSTKTLQTFWIDKYEVTNREFIQQFPEHSYRLGAEAHPVSHVTWQKAKTYCQMVGKRLPTDMEWEKAARGTDGRLYPWGDKTPKKKAHPFYSGLIKRRGGLNRRDVSFYGVRDMAGSVWEWTADQMDGKRITHGGLWNHHLDYEYSKTFERNIIDPNRRFIFLGFRCAKTN